MIPDQLAHWIQQLYLLLHNNDEKAFFLILMLEEAGIPLPMPGDVVIMFAGYRASQGLIGVLEAALAVTIGVQSGSTILYLISRRLGHSLLFKYGRLIHLDARKLEMAEKWIQRRGPVMVLAGRLTPGLRIPTSIMAGVFEIPFHQFLLYTTLSAVIWSVFWLALGYYFGMSLLPLVGRLHSPVLYAGLALPLLLVGAVVAFWRRRRKAAATATGAEGPAEASEPPTWSATRP
ncbi:MAG: DedA family protein [Sphingomonadaceae bacterium]